MREHNNQTMVAFAQHLSKASLQSIGHPARTYTKMLHNGVVIHPEWMDKKHNEK